MSNDRVLQVLAVENQHLLVNDNGEIIRVGNNISRQVTPGDFVEIEDHITRDQAIGFAREDDPACQEAIIEKSTDEYLLVQTEAGKRILPKPDVDVSPGDEVLLTELWEFYSVFEENVVGLDDDDRHSLRHEAKVPDSSDLAPQNVPDKKCTS